MDFSNLFDNENAPKLILFQVLEARNRQRQIELKISVTMVVLSPSETAWRPSYDLFCVSIGLRSLPCNFGNMF